MIAREPSLKLGVLSFVSAVLVVCIHVPVTREPGFSLFFEILFGAKIPSIAVPLFFAVSGYLLANRIDVQGGYMVSLKKRVRSLLIPYLFWCLALGLQGNLNALLSNIASNYPIMRHIDLDPMHIWGLDITTNPPLPLWFLRALMLYVLASPVFLFVSKRNWAMLLLVVVLAIFNYTMNLFVSQRLTTLFSFTLAPVNILAFVCGMRFCCHPVRISPRIGCYLLLFGTSLFCVLSLLICLNVKLASLVSALLSWLAIVSTLAGAWSVCPAVELPSRFRGQSFPIYLLHALFVPYVLLLAQKFKILLSWPGFILNVCVIVTGSLLLSWFLHKYLPRFSKLVFGGR